MQKQKKKYKYEKKKFNKFIKKNTQIKTKLRSRKIFKNKPYLLNSKIQQILKIRGSNKSAKRLSIRVTSNNVFCTLIDLKKKRTLSSGSSGKYSIKTSRKKLKFSIKIILRSFLKEIKKKLNTESLILNILGPIKLRKNILRLLQESKILFNKTTTIINIDEKKCFNGCRPKKKKRKKRKGLRILK